MKIRHFTHSTFVPGGGAVDRRVPTALCPTAAAADAQPHRRRHGRSRRPVAADAGPARQPPPRRPHPRRRAGPQSFTAISHLDERKKTALYKKIRPGLFLTIEVGSDSAMADFSNWSRRRQALHLLLQCGYNVEEALRRRKMNSVAPCDTASLWSEDECRNFESGLRVHGKDFIRIQQQQVCVRSLRSSHVPFRYDPVRDGPRFTGISSACYLTSWILPGLTVLTQRRGLPSLADFYSAATDLNAAFAD